MVAGVMYYQSLPEIETDPAAGKQTLASRLGKEGAVLLFRLWWPAVWVLLLNLWACGLADWPVALGLLTIPLHRRAVRLTRGALANGDWLSLDAHGHLVRKLYLCNGLALILGVGFAPLRGVGMDVARRGGKIGFVRRKAVFGQGELHQSPTSPPWERESRRWF